MGYWGEWVDGMNRMNEILPSPDLTTDPFAFFTDSLVAERGASQNTVVAYGRDLQHCLDFLISRQPPQVRSLAMARREDLESYFSYLLGQGYSPQTRARRRVSLRQYFQFLVTEKYRQDNPMTLIDSPHLGRPLPKILEQNAIEILLNCAEQEAQLAESLIEGGTGRLKAAARARRMVLQLELLWGSGLRVTELLTLPLRNLRPKEGLVFVKGKGERERLIPVTDPCLQALTSYLPYRKNWYLVAGQSSPLLFPRPKDPRPQNRSDFWRELKGLAMRAGIDPGLVSPHKLRHSCATAMLIGGANLREVQSMLGHADIVTTEVYTHLAIDHLQDMVETHHPLARDNLHQPAKPLTED